MASSENNRSTTEKPSFPPTEHQLSQCTTNQHHGSPHETLRHEPRPASILVTSPRVYTRHICWANQLPTRQSASATRPAPPRFTAPSTPCRLQRGRLSEHRPLRSRPPSPYPWPTGLPSPETSPARSTERHVQFDSLPCSDRDRDRNKRNNLRKRSPSPYPGQGMAQSEKEESDSHDTETSEKKKPSKSFWQTLLDFEVSFLTLSATAYDPKPRKEGEGDSYDKEKD
ncbi:uncharacterized protein F4807DRAFT_461819 [Annulohypoxylon truncatum]|uniref:uncharacterized protein n=1 Tax=Annulohypoxylon truncatum TaxID=327061 RepID=UPI0020076A58|nr:uncharacterized protein F4807DRAFT_461819 [Annulohypoxylon truncatum]KAI1208493.1 hypothetical protein F4807DRAFT_461819 [Annulohypoxylon truncatum]